MIEIYRGFEIRSTEEDLIECITLKITSSNIDSIKGGIDLFYSSNIDFDETPVEWEAGQLKQSGVIIGSWRDTYIIRDDINNRLTWCRRESWDIVKAGSCEDIFDELLWLNNFDIMAQNKADRIIREKELALKAEILKIRCDLESVVTKGKLRRNQLSYQMAAASIAKTGIR